MGGWVGGWVRAHFVSSVFVFSHAFSHPKHVYQKRSVLDTDFVGGNDICKSIFKWSLVNPLQSSQPNAGHLVYAYHTHFTLTKCKS